MSKEVEAIYDRLVSNQHTIHIESKLISPKEIATIFEYITQLELKRLEYEQALTPPTREEMVKELNKYFRRGYEGYKIIIDVVYYGSKKTFVLFKGRNKSVIASMTKYGVSINRKIPCLLAHKITTFFIDKEEII